MPRSCTICSHSKKSEMDEALVGSISFRAVAERFNVSVGALHRHKQHLPSHLLKAKEAHQMLDAGRLIDHLESLRTETLDVLTAAKKAKDGRTMLAAIARAENQLRLGAELFEALHKLQGRVIRSSADLTDEELDCLISEAKAQREASDPGTAQAARRRDASGADGGHRVAAAQRTRLHQWHAGQENGTHGRFGQERERRTHLLA